MIDEFFRFAVFEVGILLGVKINRIPYAVQVYARGERKSRREIFIRRPHGFRIVDAHAIGKNFHRSNPVGLDDVNRLGVAAHEPLYPVAILSKLAALHVQRRLREVGAHISHVREDPIAGFRHNG
jgi:hypothetical protein